VSISATEDKDFRYDTAASFGSQSTPGEQSSSRHSSLRSVYLLFIGPKCT
jgi:hypothetical protein